MTPKLAANIAAVIGGMIPVYHLDGSVERWMTSKSILSQERAEMVTVIRDRKGVIKRAFRRREDKSTNLLRTAHMGTAYSYRESLDDGHRCSDLTRIGRRKRGPNDKDYAPEHLRPIFLSVVTSCVVEKQPTEGKPHFPAMAAAA